MIPGETYYGNRYKTELVLRLGGVPCSKCEDERRRMNGMTREQCIAERRQIVRGTIERAKSSRRWWDRVRAKLGDAVAPEAVERVVGECFDVALSVEPPPKEL